MLTKFKITLVVLLLVSSQGLFGGATPSSDDIAVRIALPQETICLGTKSSTLEIYVTNASSKDVSISREWMFSGKEYEVVYDMKEGIARIDSLETRSDPISSLNLGRTSDVLPARSARRYETRMALDHDFFKKPAFYKVRVHYRGAVLQPNGTFQEVQFPSNWVLFQIESCPAKAGQ